jgi:cytochrome P450
LNASQINSINSSFWTLYYILENHEVKEKIIIEINEKFNENDPSSLKNLKLLNDCIKESDRLVNYNNSSSFFFFFFL